MISGIGRLLVDNSSSGSEFRRILGPDQAGDGVAALHVRGPPCVCLKKTLSPGLMIASERLPVSVMSAPVSNQ